VLLLNGDREAALRQAEQALSVDPRNRDAIAFTALLYAQAGSIDRSMAQIDAGIDAQDPNDDVAIKYLRRVRVSILAEIGEEERSETEMIRLASDYPEETRYQLSLIRLYASQGRVREAEAVIRKLIAAEPDNAEWRVRLAALLARQDNAEEAEAELRQAIANDSDSVTLKFALGGLYQNLGRREEARALYEAIVTVNPLIADGLAARNLIAQSYVLVDDDKARALYNDILDDAPDNVDALLYRASYATRDDDLDAAIGDLRSALNREPDSSRVLLPIARVYTLAGEALLAEDAYRTLLEVEPANKAAINELAVLVGNRGDIAEAEALLRDSLKIRPDDPQAARNLVNALLVQRDFETAEIEARQLADSGDDTGMADYQLGLALQAQAKNNEAIAAFQRAVKKSPEQPEPLIALVQLLLNSKRAEEAERTLTEHLSEHPEQLRAKALLAELYAATDRVGEAEKVYRAIIAERSDAVGAYIGLAGLYPPNGAKRMTVLEAGVAANPNSHQLGLALGSVYEKLGEFEHAIRTYEKTLNEAGNADLIAHNLAALLLDYREDPGSHERALELASRFESDNNPPASRAVLGWAYYRTGDYARAVRYLEQAAAAAGNEAVQLQYYLGMAYIKDGNPVAAKHHLQIAVNGARAANASFTGLDEARAALDELDAASS